MTKVRSLIKDSQGTIWKSDIYGRLSRLEGSLWKGLSVEWKFLGVGRDFRLDDLGTVWVLQPDSVSCLRKGEHEFIKIPYRGVPPTLPLFEPSHLAWNWILNFGGPNKPVCSASYSLHYRLYDDAPVPIGPGIADEFGYHWTGTLGEGLRRTKVKQPTHQGEDLQPDASALVEPFRKQDGLSSDYVNEIASDTEGNIWVATTGGLDLFRRVALAFVPFPQDSSGFSLVAGDQGDMWAMLAYGKDNFYRISGGKS